MNENSKADQSPTSPPEAADKKELTKVERLRGHLKPASLAAVLLDAWDDGADAQQKRTKMLSALQSYTTGEDVENASTPTE